MKTLLITSILNLACFSLILGQNFKQPFSFYQPTDAVQYFMPDNTEQIPWKNCPLVSLTAKDSTPRFNNSYFVRYNTTISDVLEDDDGYYLIGFCQHKTNTTHDPNNHTILFRLKTDKQGNQLWLIEDSIANGKHYTQYNHSIAKLSDGSFLGMGNLINDYQNPKNYESILPIYIRFDNNGNSIFSKLIADTVGRRYGFWPQSVIAEPESGFSVAGLLGSQSRTWNSQREFWYHDTTYIAIISYDSLGNETKRKLHFVGGEPRTAGVNGMIKYASGDYLIYGTKYKNYPASYLRSTFLLRLDSNFNIVSINTFGQMFCTPVTQSHIIHSGGEYYFAVNRADTPLLGIPEQSYYTNYFHFGKMDSAFNIVKDTVFQTPGLHNPHELRAGLLMGFARLDNGNFIAGGEHAWGADVIWFNEDISVYKYRHYWQYSSHYYPAQWLRDIRAANDNGVLIVGLSTGNKRGGWFVKTDSLGFSLPNGGDTLMHLSIETYNNVLSKTELIAFPNPTTDYLTIQTKDNSSLPQATLQIFNMQGALQMEINIPKHQNQLQLNLSYLPAGLYLGRIISSSGEGGGFRFVKE